MLAGRKAANDRNGFFYLDHMSLHIAIQKSGRLYEQSVQLLSECGLRISNTKGQLKAEVRDFDATIFFLRNSDIPNTWKME